MAEIHDARAHRRIDELEVRQHNLEVAITENTQLTKQIANNTSEIVLLFKGVKGVRTFMLWLAPPTAILIAAWEWIRLH